MGTHSVKLVCEQRHGRGRTAAILHRAFSITSQPKTYQEGDIIFHQGALSQHVFLITSGLVKLTHLAENGQEFLVNLQFPGELLGTSSIVLRESYLVTATALGRCIVHSVPAESFLRWLEADTELSMAMLQMLSNESDERLLRVSQVACLMAEERLQYLLFHLVSVLQPGRSSGEVRIQLPLKHAEIANFIAITPEHLSVILKRLEQKGVISRKKGWLIITDVQRLARPGR